MSIFNRKCRNGSLYTKSNRSDNDDKKWKQIDASYSMLVNIAKKLFPSYVFGENFVML